VTEEPSAELLERATALSSRAAEPAVSGNVVLGTAGWTDPSLVKSHLFYPRGASSPEARLRHYAQHFGMVEVDATYYTLIAPSVAERWIEWTPSSFRFDVKANPVLTGHPIDVTRLPGDLRARLPESEEGPHRIYPDKLPPDVAGEIESRFRAFVDTLQRAGRLGSVLLQLPPWTTATRGNAKKLEAVLARWHDVPVAVEFRNKSWMDEGRRARVLSLLSDARASYVVVDEPDVPLGGVPPVVAVTNPALAVVRFHGHNARGWRRGATVAERFDYLYSPEELAAWVAPVKRLATQAGNVHAVFNNCVRNYAVLGAKGLAVLLDQSPA
jgi:uncharacterized protein YecE (DUF72 family)